MSKWNERGVIDKEPGNELGIWNGVDLLYCCDSVSIREISQGGPYAYVVVGHRGSEIEAYESALASLGTLADECRATLAVKRAARAQRSMDTNK